MEMIVFFIKVNLVHKLKHFSIEINFKIVKILNKKSYYILFKNSIFATLIKSTIVL